MLQLRILTNILKIFLYIEGKNIYCFQHCNNTVNLKHRVYFTFYSAIDVKTLQKANSC